MKVDDGGDSFKGSLVVGATRSTFNGTRNAMLQRAYAVQRRGLRNLGNTCYQNSLMQSLFMTKELRNEIISARFAASNMEEVETQLSVLRHLQGLYSGLVAQRSQYIDPSLFHRTLPMDPWGNKQQQDCYQFLLYLWDLLEAYMARQSGRALPSGVDNLRKHLFGGVFADATVCSNCGSTSEHNDPFSELQLVLSDNFTPIIDIVAVSGKTADVAPPDGYERIHTNLNSGRAGSEYCYLCIRRAQSWDEHGM